MRIKEAQSALLSNHEVLLHLQEQEAEYSGKLVLKSGEEEKPEGEEEPTAKEKPEEEKNTGEEEKSGEVEKEDKKPAEPAVKYMPAREKPKGLKDVLQDTLAYLSTAQQKPALKTVVKAHSKRPMTLYKGPHSLMRVLAPKFRLNRVEYLMLYNLRPQSQVELQLIIEESAIRFTEDQLDQILALIAQVFDEDESSIPADVENLEMEKISNKLLGASKKKKKAPRPQRRAAAE